MSQRPDLGPNQQPPLPLIQMREDHPKLRRQHLPGFLHSAHTTPMCQTRRQGPLAVCRRRLVVLADHGGDLGVPLAGAWLAGRVLGPAGQRGFDPAGADAWPAWPVQVRQNRAADAADQVRRFGDDPAGPVTSIWAVWTAIW